LAGRQAIAEVDQPLAVDALVRKAQAGDLTAFEELYRLYVSRVFGVCMRMTADPATAEELTQQAFIRTWQKLHLFKGERRFEPWLVTLTVNVVRSDRRAWGRRQEKETAVEDLERFGSEGAHASPAAGMDLEKAMAKVPPKARQVFYLHDVEGYRHKEIGEIMGVAVGTSKAQLHRARKILREVLAT
jgi:RNA polymerase sigma-70 factor (ECF subfamily)